VQRARDLAAAHPTACEVTYLPGTTHDGHRIAALRVGAAATSSGEPTKRVMVVGMQHAREWLSAMVPLFMAERLLADAAFNQEPAATALQTVQVRITFITRHTAL
jgi:hypothetical protein